MCLYLNKMFLSGWLLWVKTKFQLGPVSPRCLLWQNWSRNYFLPRASLAVLRLVYDGLIFRTRAPETTLIFYKRDLHKYIATHYTRCEHSSSCTHFLSLEVRATIRSSRGEYFTICGFLVILRIIKSQHCIGEIWVKIPAVITLPRQKGNFYTNFQRIKIHK